MPWHIYSRVCLSRPVPAGQTDSDSPVGDCEHTVGHRPRTALPAHLPTQPTDLLPAALPYLPTLPAAFPARQHTACLLTFCGTCRSICAVGALPTPPHGALLFITCHPVPALPPCRVRWTRCSAVGCRRLAPTTPLPLCCSPLAGYLHLHTPTPRCPPHTPTCLPVPPHAPAAHLTLPHPLPTMPLDTPVGRTTRYALLPPPPTHLLPTPPSAWPATCLP